MKKLLLGMLAIPLFSFSQFAVHLDVGRVELSDVYERKTWSWSTGLRYDFNRDLGLRASYRVTNYHNGPYKNYELQASYFPYRGKQIQLQTFAGPSYNTVTRKINPSVGLTGLISLDGITYVSIGWQTTTSGRVGNMDTATNITLGVVCNLKLEKRYKKIKYRR